MPPQPQQETITAGGKSAAGRWKTRLYAWWEGYELPEAVPERAAPRVSLARAEGAAAPRGGPEQGSALLLPQVQVMRKLWGGDFVSPGDEEHVLDLVKPLGLNPKMSLLDFGAGIGGPARAMSKEFGVWITGLESSQDFVRAGGELSTAAGMGKRVTISAVDAKKPVLPERRFDCIFAKESLGQVPEKQKLFADMVKSLKPGGHVLFTDYVLTKAIGDAEASAWLDWCGRELGIPHPWRSYQLLDAMNDAGLDIRINEDITERYMSLVLGRWQLWEEFVKAFDGGSPSAQERMTMLLGKAQLWTQRIAALRSGELRVFRFHAMKRGSQKLMSNW
jgi:cyclopropane fatty-acyl-phospholipid synthase-like methyltransferase